MILRLSLRGNLNVIFMGLGFMFIFTAFNTVTMVQQTLIDTIKLERSFNADGFVSMGITYLTMLLFCWVAPSVVDRFGAVLSMVISSLIFLVYISVFINLTPFSLYAVAALLGIGASILWTAQGVYITSISTEETTSRNIGYFWSFFQGSFFFGNLILLLLLRKSNFQDVYKTLFICLTFISGTGICFLSALFLPCLRTVVPPKDAVGSIFSQILKTFRLFLNPNIILISFSSLFNGINFAFMSGVFPTCVTRTEYFGEYGKTLITIMFIAIGVGEITGGILSSRRFLIKRYGRVSIFFIGYVLNTVCYYSIYNTLPGVTTSHSSAEIPLFMIYFTNNTEFLIIAIGFLLGLSDGLVCTQIMALITENYYEESSEAYAIFKFVQSSGSALSFFTSAYLWLDRLMLSYFILQTVALFSYYFAEINLLKKSHEVN